LKWWTSDSQPPAMNGRRTFRLEVTYQEGRFALMHTRDSRAIEVSRGILQHWATKQYPDDARSHALSILHAAAWTISQPLARESGRTSRESHADVSLFVERRRRGGVNGAAGQEIGVAESEVRITEAFGGFRMYVDGCAASDSAGCRAHEDHGSKSEQQFVFSN
jgi:hypothetical protein